MILLLPAFYCILLIVLIYNRQWFKKIGLPIRFITAIFITKVLLSIIYTYLHFEIYGGADISTYYNDSMIIYNSFKQSPLKYLMLTLGPNNLLQTPDFIAQEVDAMGYWNDSSSYSIIRFYAVCNLISNGNIYVAGVFMAFLSTVGLLFLYKSIMICSPHLSESILLKVILFASPSFMFWSSGVHKEGLIITGLGMLFYCVSSIIQQRKFSQVNLLLIVFSSWLVWYVRDFIFYLLIPGIIGILLSEFLLKKKIMLAFIAAYGMCIAAGYFYEFNLKNERHNYMKAIELKRMQFKEHIGGDANIEIPDQKPDLVHIFQYVPSSFIRVFNIPFYLEKIKSFHWIFLIENFMMYMLLIYLIYRIMCQGIELNLVYLWQLLFAITVFVLIGLVVSNIGAIIRYRSITLPFLFIPLLSMIKVESKNVYILH
jgi:hypothetical protein